eukprot:g8655.t1
MPNGKRQGSDWEKPSGMKGEDKEISEGDTRLILKNFLDWLQDHDLAHSFVDEVDAHEYPEYKKVVKKPMNLARKRKRLGNGVYDSWRGGVTLFMEDVDWMRHNCIMFNGDRAAISRSAVLLCQRAESAQLTLMVDILRRPGWEGAHRTPAFARKRSGGSVAAGASRSGAAKGGGGVARPASASARANPLCRHGRSEEMNRRRRRHPWLPLDADVGVNVDADDLLDVQPTAPVRMTGGAVTSDF